MFKIYSTRPRAQLHEVFLKNKTLLKLADCCANVAALKLADGGQVIDNLILIGSPISDKSDLWKQLSSNKNIKNVIRYDISGDALSNPQDVWDFIKGGFQNSSDDGPHFDAARQGAQANTLIQNIVQWLKDQGVKN